MPTTVTHARWIREPGGVAREAHWDVDEKVLGATQSWARKRAQRRRELEAMASMYPAWSLTLASAEEIVRRPGCHDWAVPTGGAWCWASDGTPLREMPRAGLAWFGLLPAPLAGLPRAEEKLREFYPVQEIAGQPWTTVPVRAVYPDGFPHSEPLLFYETQWLDALSVKQNARNHILYAGRMCLFYPGHWKRSYTVADVLSRRAVNHVYSILKIGNGLTAGKAFIGKIDNRKWKPKPAKWTGIRNEFRNPE
jgi:hypothetical protein